MRHVALHINTSATAKGQIYQAFCQTQCHRGIVSPLPTIEIKGATADHISDGLKGARWFEFQSGAQRIANGKTQQGP